MKQDNCYNGGPSLGEGSMYWVILFESIDKKDDIYYVI